jgi:hypothetical protein
MSSPRRLKRSLMAQEFARWAPLSYEFALILVTIDLFVAGAFAVLSPESFIIRLLTFVFLGIVPALLTFLIGCLTYLALKGASAICDPLVALTSRVLINIALISWRLLGRPAIKLLGRWGRALASELVLAFRSAAVLLLYAAQRFSRAAWRTFVFGVTFPVRLVARLLIRLIPSTDYRGVELHRPSRSAA